MLNHLSLQDDIHLPLLDEKSSHNFASLVLDEIANGLIVCDLHGELHFANRGAWDELATEKALRLVGNQIRVASGPSACLDDAILAAAVQGKRAMLTLAGPEQLMLAVIPLGSTLGGAAPVLLVLGGRGVCSELGLEMLGQTYRLSAAERRVMNALVERVAPRDIAERHGVALSTVRSQIKSIRDKLGVANIEGIFVRAAQVPPVALAWGRVALTERRRFSNPRSVAFLAN